MKYILLSLMLAFLAGCDVKELQKSLIPEAESEFAKEYMEKLRAQNFDHVLSYIRPDLLETLTNKKLLEVAQYFPSGELLSVEIIGSSVYKSPDLWRGKFTFEYQFPESWALASVSMEKASEKYQVIGFNVYQTKASQKEINAFTLSDKNIIHFITLLLTVLVPLFILVTFVVLIRTPMKKKKRWGVFVLFGFGAFQLNWTTGQFSLQILAFKLFGAGAVSSGIYAPWVLSFSIPLGAMLFWLKRNKWLTEANTQQIDLEESEEKS